MRCLTLLTLLVLAMLAVGASAGKVVINGACVDCNKPDVTTTTRKPATTHASRGGGHGRGRTTTAKPKKKNNKKKNDDDDDDFNLGDFSLSQDANGAQHITNNRRHKRQFGHRQVIITDPGYGGGGGNGGWSGRVTTLDARGQPGTLTHNDDCVGCNIRG